MPTEDTWLLKRPELKSQLCPRLKYTSSLNPSFANVLNMGVDINFTLCIKMDL